MAVHLLYPTFSSPSLIKLCAGVGETGLQPNSLINPFARKHFLQIMFFFFFEVHSAKALLPRSSSTPVTSSICNPRILVNPGADIEAGHPGRAAKALREERQALVREPSTMLPGLFMLEATNSPVCEKGRSVEIRYLWKISKWWLPCCKKCLVIFFKVQLLTPRTVEAQRIASSPARNRKPYRALAAPLPRQWQVDWVSSISIAFFPRLWSREAWIAKEAAHVSDPIFSIKSVTNAIVLYK